MGGCIAANVVVEMRVRFYIDEDDEEVEVPDDIPQEVLEDMFDRWFDGHLTCGYVDVSGKDDEVYKGW